MNKIIKLIGISFVAILGVFLIKTTPLFAENANYY